MSKPYLAGHPGEEAICFTEQGKETWQWRPGIEEPLFMVWTGLRGEVASGLPRAEAARLAGLLFHDPQCDFVRLAALPPAGDWHLLRVVPLSEGGAEP